MVFHVSDGEQGQEIQDQLNIMQDCRATKTQIPKPHFNALTTKPFSFLLTTIRLYLSGYVIIAIGLYLCNAGVFQLLFHLLFGWFIHAGMAVTSGTPLNWTVMLWQILIFKTN